MRAMVLVGGCLGLLFYVQSAAAFDPSQDDITCALDPKCTRPVVRDARGVISSGGTAHERLSIDLYVNFAYDSAELTSDARITLDRLGYALRDERLKGFSFLIAGHTDAKGSVEYNQKLSERRAQAVKSYLITQFGIDSALLTARGFGKSQLLDPSRPEDGVNRRVQIVNSTVSGQR